MQIKLFQAVDSRLLEQEINRWLENNSWVKIINLTQSSGNNSTTISIWYEEPHVPMLG